jgi:caffeoyl-CoA O-methyltransferase
MAQLVMAAAAAYAEAHTSPFQGEIAQAADWTQRNTSSPQMMSGLPEARLLEALIVVSGARRVLEVGTFTAVGSLAMASALPEGGKVITLEVDEENARIARRHLDASPWGQRVELIVGDALETIGRVDGPLDLVYVDARKSQYPDYYEAVLPKLSERGILVADNVLRGGRVLDGDGGNPDDAGMQAFAQRVQADARVHNVLLTVGDGVMLAWPAP